MAQKTSSTGFWLNFHNRLKTLSTIEIFALLAVASLTVFMVKFFGNKQETKIILVEVIKKNWTENYDPYGYRAPFWLSEKIKVGQKEFNYTGKPIAELIYFDNYERGSEEAELYLTLKVVVNHNTRTNQYIFHNKPIALGSAIELNLDNNLIEGQIVDMNPPSNGYPRHNFQVVLRVRNAEPWTVSNVLVGDKVTDRATGQTIAEITDVKIEDPTSQQISIDGNSILQINKRPDIKDMVITTKIVATEQDGKWYFAGHQNIKMGDSLYLYTNRIYLYGLEIVDIKELS